MTTPKDSRTLTEEAEEAALLGDWRWRISHLYSIVDKDANHVAFRPNSMQVRFLKRMKRRNIILKARQLGMTTLIAIIFLDQCLFSENIHAGIIAQDERTAADLFRDKIKYAYDHLDPRLQKALVNISDSKTELEFSNGSSIRVGTSMRGRTLQFLHISEFGKICARYPDKATEIITGSLPTLGKSGWCFIESTAEGRAGRFFTMVQAARKLFDAHAVLGPKDYQFHFFAWHDDPGYRQDEPEIVTSEDHKYFNDLQLLLGKTIDDAQRRWYCAFRRSEFSGDSQMMKQEMPSVPDEAFEQSMEAHFFSTQMRKVRDGRRITDVPWQPGYPVDTFWDIGKHDGTAIWCMQRIGIDYRFIRFIEGWNEEFDHYVADLTSHGYVFGRHFLPHDAEQKRQAKNKEEAKTAKKALEELGLTNIVVVPQTQSKILSINRARALLPQCYFDQTNCANGVAHLDGYHKKPDRIHGGWLDEPDHDEHSEGADAYMQFGDGWVPLAPPLRHLKVQTRRR